MTTYFLIHDDEHNFLEGIVEIPNSAVPTNLARVNKAYFELSVPSSPVATLDKPSLIGFLYQIYEGKRSRPYPIVSQQQSINLDFNDCDGFLFVIVNRLIDDYTLKLYVANDGGGDSGSDLSSYVTTTALNTAINGFVSESQLATTLSDYALSTDIPTQNNQSVSLDLIDVSTDQSLEANKQYFVDTASLALTLPDTPSISDYIKVYNGVNSDIRINHGNSTQKIKNNNTDTLIGINNGIILKPYSMIELMFVGSNLWVSSVRGRTINNYSVPTLETTASKKTYTAIAPASAGYGAVIEGIYNGVKTTGSLSNGYLSDSATGDILITLSEAIIIDQIRLCNGQANNGAGINDPYSVRDITVYTGHTTGGENLGVYTFANTSPAEESKNITPNEIASNTFLLRVNSVTPRAIGILELEIWGKGQEGGEVLV